MGWPAVRRFEDGMDVTADNLNDPIRSLAQRTEYLRLLLANNDRAKVTVTATLTGDPVPYKGQPVYRTADGNYALAAADAEQEEWFYAAQSAMAVGVVGDTVPDDGGVPDPQTFVVLYGRVDFGADGVEASTLIVDENPESGRYFLSTTPGKLTARPNGPIVYVCNCVIQGTKVMSMIVSPQYRDTGESHIHREFVLSGLPMGGYAKKDTTLGRYTVADIRPDDPAAGTAPDIGLRLSGTWNSDDTSVKYVLELANRADPRTDTGWKALEVRCTVNGSVVPASPVDPDAPFAVGPHGIRVRIMPGPDVTPESAVGAKWTLELPKDAQAWTEYEKGGRKGYRLDLGLYPELARFAPPIPENGAVLLADGVELKGPVFGSARDWEIESAETDEDDKAVDGPFLVWYGGAIIGVSKTTPFVWVSDAEPATARDILYHGNRMRVGPTGFVTSLEVADGSPLRITSAQTGSRASQGALQIALSINFTSVGGNVPGCQVVKSIDGSTFKTGPVVERIVAGPGISVTGGGQGTVTVSASNAVYAGDFETIALKNAKQDLAGGIFPYTKLLGTGSGVPSTGFTAKFRVPDHIPYRAGKGYRVIVSASVFGESDSATESSAAFTLMNHVLADISCSDDAVGTDFPGRINAPTPGLLATIPVSFKDGYAAFDPVLLHGFEKYRDEDIQPRRYVANLLLKDEDGNPVVVYPGYFVGLDIVRATLGSVVPYAHPIGFLSLRWNLVEVP